MNSLEARVQSSFYTRAAIIGVCTFGLGYPFMLYTQRSWAKVFDDTGTTRRDGKRFLWVNLNTIRFVLISRSTGGARLNHINLMFKGGKASVFPDMLENRNEVLDFLSRLPGGQAAADYRRVRSTPGGAAE